MGLGEVDLRFLLILLMGLLCESHEAQEAASKVVQFEAAFQGQCGRGSPCQQLCYELHDGMYECDCTSGYELHDDGYSCYESNSTETSSKSEAEETEEDILYQKDAVFDVQLNLANESNEINQNLTESTTQGPRLEQKLTDTTGIPKATLPLPTEKPCPLDCGLGGGCVIENSDTPICLCPLGKSGNRCERATEINSPRFTGLSWLAFPALRGAYKHVQLTLELRPEAYDGIFFLTGERDDMAGDFMALLLHQGFVEFRFDCGSGIGVVRSEETVLLNQWNRITLYRHRWDAWLQLNSGKHVKGRSKGLFSRITFREPLFIGGTGNTTGLSEKLPISHGIKGCLRNLEVNDHAYKFAAEPRGEASKGFGIEECTADRCSRVPCQHGGKCLTSDEAAVCLCPLGFSGDLCEIRVDLQVPSFNGSSHLRYRGLGDEVLTWLDLQITLKPTAADGLVLYNGHRADGFGDFVALSLNEGFVEFTYDLGTGATTARSSKRVDVGGWHQIKVSRTGRLAILEVDNQKPIEVISSGAFTQLSLPQNLFLGGAPNFDNVSPQVRVRSEFVGCIQKVVINGRTVSILAEALGGANVNNCPHPCVARPCGENGECVPQLDYFSCRCKPGYKDHVCGNGPPYFEGQDSYLYFDNVQSLSVTTVTRLDINMRFKISSTDGLLLWLDLGLEFLSLGIEAGNLVLRYSDRAEEIVVVHNNSIVHDNLWHRIKAATVRGSGLLVVDNGAAVTTQSVEVARMRSPNPGLYVGGMPHTATNTGSRYSKGIKGCVADLVVNSYYHLQLTSSSTFGRNVAQCEV